MSIIIWKHVCSQLLRLQVHVTDINVLELYLALLHFANLPLENQFTIEQLFKFGAVHSYLNLKNNSRHHDISSKQCSSRWLQTRPKDESLHPASFDYGGEISSL